MTEKGISGPQKTYERGLSVKLCLLGFFMMLSYAVALTCSQTLYLEHLGADRLPSVWLGSAAASLVASAVVGVFSARLEIAQLLGRASITSALFLCGLLLLAPFSARGASYLLYVWKDIYIIVLAELFWTFSNVSFGVDSASRAYGLFCAAGSVAGIVGGVAAGWLVGSLGPLVTYACVLPLLGCCAYLARDLRRLAQKPPAGAPKTPPSTDRPLFAGIRVLKKSPYLLALLALVAVVQITMTLIDFEFQRTVSLVYASNAARARVLGDVTAVLNGISLVLQLGTATLIRRMGLVTCLFAAPVLLGATFAGAALMPASAGMVLCQLVCKALDYSLFRATKEILYIPLSYREKTQGKAVIDIFIYRLAKGLVSLLLLSLGATLAALWVRGITGIFIGLWMVLVVCLERLYKRRLALSRTESPVS